MAAVLVLALRESTVPRGGTEYCIIDTRKFPTATCIRLKAAVSVHHFRECFALCTANPGVLRYR